MRRWVCAGKFLAKEHRFESLDVAADTRKFAEEKCKKVGLELIGDWSNWPSKPRARCEQTSEGFNCLENWR